MKCKQFSSFTYIYYYFIYLFNYLLVYLFIYLFLSPSIVFTVLGVFLLTQLKHFSTRCVFEMLKKVVQRLVLNSN